MEIFSRYNRDSKLNRNKLLGTATATAKIRTAIRTGELAIMNIFVTSDLERLDNIAGSVYGDSRLWWVLAAASDIGWGMQIPAGTMLRVVDLRKVEELVT